MPKQTKIIKCYTEDLAVRASSVISTELVRDICAIHDTYPLASVALGRLLTGTALMASQLNDGQSVSVRLDGNGPLGQLYADATFEGGVRAYCQNPQAGLPLTDDGHLNIRQAVGQGIVAVTRNLPHQRQPQLGIVPISTGEIAEDLAHYLQQSHQIPSIVSLAVSLDKEGNVTAAGGVLIELIPGAPESVISALEEKLKKATPLSQKILAGESALDILKSYLHDSPIKHMEHDHPLVYSCRCSMERVERTLSMMGKATLAEIVLKGEPTEVKCEFCGKRYTVPVANVRNLIQLMADENSKPN